MRLLVAWVGLNALLVAANAFGAAVAWAAGRLLLDYGGGFAEEPLAWYAVAVAMVGASIALIRAAYERTCR